MLLRPQPMSIADNTALTDNPVAISATHQTTPQVLNGAEMNATIGGEMSGCFQQIAASGDVFGTCCLDLWIFSICVSVNFSAIERAIPFL
jgi:hypothetical protein